MRSLTLEVLPCVKSQSAFLRKNSQLFGAGASLLENKLKKGFGANILFICTSALWQVGMQNATLERFPFTSIFSTSEESLVHGNAGGSTCVCKSDMCSLCQLKLEVLPRKLLRVKLSYSNSMWPCWSGEVVMVIPHQLMSSPFL